MLLLFFVYVTAPTEIYTYVHSLSLLDALPISGAVQVLHEGGGDPAQRRVGAGRLDGPTGVGHGLHPGAAGVLHAVGVTGTGCRQVDAELGGDRGAQRGDRSLRLAGDGEDGVDEDIALDRKSTRLNPVTNAHLVCRLLLEKKKMQRH